jgi:chloride channel protein, CIC family
MKAMYQSFIRGGIPLSYPVNIVTEDYTEDTITSLNTPRVVCLSLLAAAIAAVFAQCMLLFINALTQLAYFTQFSVEPANPADHDLDIWGIAVPIAGAIVAVLLYRFCIKKQRMECGCYFVDPFCSAIYIGTGIPLGIEGAVFMNSYLFSNFTKNKWRTTYPERRILAAAGIVSAIAYLFGSPLGAAVLAIELLLIDFSVASILPLVIAAGTGMFFKYLYSGMDPVFVIPALPPATLNALLGYTITGAVIGAFSLLAKKLITAFSWAFRKLPVQSSFRPIVVAVIIGVAGYFAPEMLGIGHVYMNDILMGKVTPQLLFVIVIIKFVAWTLAIGGNTSGGTFMPMLILGSALGVFVAFVLQLIWPTAVLNVHIAALIGMAAMLSGGFRVLPAAIIFAFEVTQEKHVIIPLICACTAAYLIAFALSKKQNRLQTYKG